MRVQGRNPQLDGLRAFAIALVLVAHTLRFGTGPANSAREILGEIGVNVFFVLSGFLITTLLVQERTRTGKLNLKDFYARRFRRIFPAYYAYLAVMALLASLGVVAIGWPELLADAFYLRDYNVHTSSWLGHTWSLAVETQFYLLWPATILFLGNARARSVAIAAIALTPLVRIATYFLIPSQRDLISIALHTRIDTLMFGCATALLIEHGIPAWLEKALQRVKPAWCLLILALCVGASAVLRGGFQYVAGMTIEGAAVSLLLLGVIERPQMAVARLLSSGPATWVGRISYSLYLWQQPFLFPMSDSIIARFPLNVLCALGAAVLSYYLVERTFFRAKPVTVSV